MNKTFTGLVAIFWGGVIISAAVPASADVYTTQSGNYATCTSSWSKALTYHCDLDFNYRQYIKFQSTACNQGGCNVSASASYVATVYSTNRKTTSLQFQCDSGRVYELGACPC